MPAFNNFFEIYSAKICVHLSENQRERQPELKTENYSKQKLGSLAEIRRLAAELRRGF